jgi:membrane dipeptidase
MLASHRLRRALTAGDLEAAHRAGQPAIIADVEGLDFPETKIERLEEAHERGIRHLQLVHYTPNDIGDFQTGAVAHQGLTSFGAEVIRACHRLGFVCDTLLHGSPGGRSERHLVRGQARRTYSGRPSSSMRFST